METNLNRIKKLSRKKEAENWKFRAFLKSCNLPGEKIDSIVHDLFRDVSGKIDCKNCANCCRKILPLLDQDDIGRFSKGLGISPLEFKRHYLVEAEGEPGKYAFNKKPCPFLQDNLCSHYDLRPEDCRSYPHLHKEGFTSRVTGVIENCSICPIAYNVYELLKAELWHMVDI